MTVELQAAIGLGCVALDPHFQSVCFTHHQIGAHCDTDVFIHIVTQKTNRALVLLALSHKLGKVKAVGITGHILLLRPVAAGCNHRIKQ